MHKVIRDFECSQCGECCSSQDLVQLTAYELYRLARHFEMEPESFFKKYCIVTATNLNPVPHVYIKTAGGRCPFLKDNKCTVYEARPYACRAYPQRVYWSHAGDMKASVREKYPGMEACNLLKLEDGDVLLGDHELLARQQIAYWVDDAYFGMTGNEVDLSVPYRVADLYIHDREMMGIAKRYVVNPEHPPSAFDAELAFAKISLTLHAARWNVTSAFVTIGGQSVHEDERMGKYILFTSDEDSVKALRMLVECGRLDLAKTLALESKVYGDRVIIAALHGSFSDHVAIGFHFAVDRAMLDELTDGGKKPLYTFFAVEGAAEGKLTGFPLNIKI
jgi:Fe-S-cluster containining protein